MTSYHDYFSCAETKTSRGRYAYVLVTYFVDPVATATAAAPADVVRLIYDTTQEGVLTAYLQWNQGVRARGAEIALLHSV